MNIKSLNFGEDCVWASHHIDHRDPWSGFVEACDAVTIACETKLGLEPKTLKWELTEDRFIIRLTQEQLLVLKMVM